MRRRKTGGEGEETCLVAASRTSPASHDDGVIATLDNKERRPYEHTRKGSCRRRRTSNGCCGCKKKLLVSARRRVAMVDKGPRAATAMAMARLPPSFSLPLPLSLALFCLYPALLCVLYSVHSSRRSRKTKSFAFSNPYLKGNLLPDREHHGVILFIGFWCGLYIILVAAASLMSLGPDNPSHDLLHMCRRFFAILSLSLQFQFCIIVISSLQNVSSSPSSLVVCFLKNSFMSARLTCSSCSSSWILCVLHLCCGVYITNPGKNFISLFENRS